MTRKRRNGSILRGATCVVIALQAASCLSQSPVLTLERRRDLELRPGIVTVYLPIVAAIPSLGLSCEEGLSGTGFLYRPDGYLITNGHVVQIAQRNDDEAKGKFRDVVIGCLKREWERKHQATMTDEQFKLLDQVPAAEFRIPHRRLIVFLENKMQYDGSIVKYSPPFLNTVNPGKDIAIIKIDGNNLPTVSLGDSSTVHVHDPIYVIGYPGVANISNTSQLVASTTDGIISAVKNIDNSQTPLLQTNAMINHGNSGGPAFDGTDRAIGVATMSADPGYNFLVPIDTAMEFVREAGSEPQHTTGGFDKTWHEALDAYANKHWAEAHRLTNSALEMLPGEPQVLQLQQWAAAAERTESPWEHLQESVSSTALIGVAAFLLLLIGGGVFAVTRTRAVPALSAAAAPNSLEPAAPTAARVIEAEPSKPVGSLHVSSGPLLGNSFPIPKAGLLIGRDPSRCAVVLPDDSVSGEHAWVVPLDNGVAVIDRNSSNGTFINSTDSPRINKVILRHGDRILLGRKNPTTLTFYSA